MAYEFDEPFGVDELIRQALRDGLHVLNAASREPVVMARSPGSRGAGGEVRPAADHARGPDARGVLAGAELMMASTITRRGSDRTAGG